MSGSEESVLFEIQVDKSILEKLLLDNKNFKETYGKLTKLEDNIKTLKDENNGLILENEKLKRNEIELIEENLRLETQIKQLEKIKRLYAGKCETKDLEVTQSKLLSMKLRKMEDEKMNIVIEFEKEKKILEELLHDNSKIKKLQDDLTQARQDCDNLSLELDKTKKLLTKSEEENNKLDEDKLNLETQIKKLDTKIRLLEEENISSNLEEVENKLLRLKLKNLEKDKEYLMNDIERERKLLNNQGKPRIARVEENIKLLRKWIEKEMKERRPRVTQEEKELREKIEKLEKEKEDLVEGFELERKVFRKIMRGEESYPLNC